MSTLRLSALALSLLLLVASEDAMAARAPHTQDPDPLAAALAEQHAVSTDVQQRVDELIAAARDERSTNFRRCFDREGVLDRAELLVGAELNAIERMALRRESLTPIIDGLEESLRASLAHGPAQVRMQRELPDGLRSVVVRLQTNWVPADYYLFLVVTSEDDDTLIVDFEFEDAAAWASEQVALVSWFMRASQEEQNRLTAYSQRLPAVMEAYDSGETEQGYRGLAELQPRVEGLPLQVPTVYERLLMEYAYSVGELNAARAAADRLLVRRPDCALALFYLGRIALDEGRFGEAREQFGLYQSRVGLDASSLTYVGDSYLREDRKDEALQRWGSALDQNAGHDAALSALGLHLPDDRRAELLARLRAVPDLSDRIEELLLSWWEHEACGSVAAASELLRELHPEDANGYYYQTQCTLDAEDAESALPLALRGRELAPHEELEAYDRLVIRAVAAKEGSLAGYAAAQLKAVAFDYLAYELSNDAEGVDELLELVAAREKDDPREIWLHYYRGKAFGLRGDAAAEREQYALGEALAAELQDEEGIGAYRYAAVRAAYDAHEAAAAYEQRPREDVYDWLLGWALGDRDGAAIEELMVVRRKLQPDDAEVPFWEAHAWILTGREAQGVERLLEGRELFEANENLRGWLELDLVTGLNALGRFEEALEVARRSTERDGDALYELYVYVAQG